MYDINSKWKIQWKDSMVHIFPKIYEKEMEQINCRTGHLKDLSGQTMKHTFLSLLGEHIQNNFGIGIGKVKRV